MELKEVKDLIEKQGQAWEEFKKTNDAAIQAKADGKAIGDLEAKLAALNEALDKVQTKLSRPGVLATKSEDRQSPEAEAYKAAFMSWVRNPSDPERRTALQLRARELRKVETKAGGDEDGFETRAVQTVTSTGSAGGFALPEIIERQIQRLSVDISPIRQISTVRTVGSPDYKELFDINGAAFEWVGEAGTRSQTNTPDLAEVAPTFGMASARPRAPPVEGPASLEVVIHRVLRRGTHAVHGQVRSRAAQAVLLVGLGQVLGKRGGSHPTRSLLTRGVD